MQKKNVEDIFPLTELQEELLVHRLRRIRADGASVGDSSGETPRSGGSGVGDDTGFLLLEGRFDGPLDRPRFGRAWRDTVAAHPALRTSVHWESTPRPIQVVARTIEAEVEYDDWVESESAVRTARWSDERAAFRADGVDLRRAPVWRFRLVRVREDEHWWRWACHHVLLDGWSSALVLAGILERYRALSEGRAFEDGAGRAFREYAVWLRDQPAPGGEAVRALVEPAKVLEAPYLGGATPSPDAAIDGLSEREISKFDHRGLEAAARTFGVTASVLLHGAWALVLAEATAHDNPAFGFTTSGRSADFAGIESMVGMFANTLPLTLKVDRAQPVRAWLHEVHARQQALQSLETHSLVRLMEVGGVALRRAPFDTLVAYASFPSPVADDNAAAGDRTAIAVGEMQGDVTSGYPLTVSVRPPVGRDGKLVVGAHYASSRFEASTVGRILDRFEVLLATLLESVEGEGAATVGDWLRSSAGDLSVVEPFRSRLDPEVAVAVRPLGGTGATAPRTATEAQMMRIWNDLVDVQEYGVDDNFFDLGGHSLLVPQMIERIRQDFDVELPIGLVAGSPTVSALARWIDKQSDKGSVEGQTEEQQHDRSWPCLVPVRVPAQWDGARAPLFMVHGLGGEVGWFYNLANYLAPDVPLYGLQAPSEPHDDLPAMATRYIGEVRAMQPRGPYRLGGYCVGGGVAYEMAQQLESAGETVEVLVLIDSVPQAHAFGAEGSTQALGRVRRLMSKPPSEIVSSVVDAARRGAQSVARKAKSAGGGDSRALELPDVLDMRTLPEVYHHASVQHFRAMRDYEPKPYAGEVWLFRTDEPRFGDDFGWRPLVGGELRVESIDGRHVDVLKEPHVRGLGRKLSAALDSIDRGGPGDRKDLRPEVVASAAGPRDRS